MHWVYLLQNAQGKSRVGQTDDSAARLYPYNRTDRLAGIVRLKAGANGQSLGSPMCLQTPRAVLAPFLTMALAWNCVAAETVSPLTLDRINNWLVIKGAHLPTAEVRINYLEAYCRANSTDADWLAHTNMKHTTEVLSVEPGNKVIRLKCTPEDGVTVAHTNR
jgi:hypothetical protein